MTIKSIIFSVVLLAAIIFFIRSISRLVSYLKIAQPETRWNNVWKRIAYTLKVALAQTKIFRDFPAGPIHAGIFWGFLVLLFSAAEAIIQGFFHEFTLGFLGPVYSVIMVMTDIFCGLILIAIIFSFLRRYIFKVKRLQGDAEEKRDAFIVLMLIFIIVSSLLIENSACKIIHPYRAEAFCPISLAIGSIMTGETAPIFYEIFWWIHIVVILIFANYLPFSKHLHVYTSIPNVFFSKIGPVNKLEKIDFEKEGVEKFGVVEIVDFTWKSLFDGYSCTHCGRCTSVCPANNTGKALSPREVIVQIRNRTMDAAPIFIKQNKINAATENINGSQTIELNETEQKILDKKFVGEYEDIESLWQCTTCGACMQECPVTIEHVPAIVGMRRSLVMMEANFPAEVQPAFANLENNFTPWAFSPAERADWADGTGIKTAAENPDFDVLFWVGCAGSYDDRAKKISLAFSKLMQIAGVNFSILGTEEQCNGDFARRSGNEYLADMLIKMNVETLNRYNVKKIVTFCPHCYNTFKNEYPDFGGNYEVIHHSEFLSQLINERKLNLKTNGSNKNIVYHDSCYLGRYNNIYKAPRTVLRSIDGVNLIEPKRNKSKAFCCGAGGGQMFMEETVGKRVNIERTEELINSGAKTIAMNCPFCMTMITDGVKDKDLIEEIEVKDIAEIILENIE